MINVTENTMYDTWCILEDGTLLPYDAMGDTPNDYDDCECFKYVGKGFPVVVEGNFVDWEEEQYFFQYK